MLARSIALGFVIAALAACAARIAARQPEPCPEGRWSEPRDMKVGANGYAYVQSPQAVVTRTGTVFLGNSAMVLSITDTGFGRIAGWPRGPGMLAGVIRRPDGRLEPLPLPHHLRSFVGVRAVGDRSGRAHVFWGDSPDTTIDQWRHLRGVTYASFDGVRWSEPVAVFRDSTIRWDPVYSSILVRNDTVHVVVSAFGRNRPDLVHVTRLPDGQFVVRRHPFAASYTSLAAAADGSLLLAYIHGGWSGTREQARDRNVISVVRSSDGGATWSDPVAIYRSPSAGAYAVRLVQTRDALHAVWESSPPLAPEPGVAVSMRLELHDSIQAAVSLDAGRSWSRLPGLFTPAGIGGLEAARGPDDVVHVIYHSGMRDSVGTIVTAALRNQRWGAPRTMGSGQIWPTLNTVADSLILSWDRWHIIPPDNALIMQSSALACPSRTQSH